MKTHLKALSNLLQGNTQNSYYVYLAGTNLVYKANNNINIVKLTSPVKIVWDKQYLNYDWYKSTKFVTKADTLVTYNNDKALAKKLRAIFRAAANASNLLQLTLTDEATLNLDTLFSKNLVIHSKAYFISHVRGLRFVKNVATAFTGKGKFRLKHRSEVKYSKGTYKANATMSKLASSEANDCGVRALAAAASISYDKAHSALKFQGRKNRKGIWMPMFESAIKPFKNCDKLYDFFNFTLNNEYKLTGNITVKKAIKLGLITGKGIYVVAITGHVYTIIDGVCHGWLSDAKSARSRVKQVYKITNK